MDSRTIKALEFGKVLEHLAGLCVSEAGRRVSLGLFPLRDADAVNAAHTLFDEVRTWSAHSGFRLSDFPDLEGLFPHLEKAAVSPSSALLDADALWALRETLLQGRKAAQSINENGTMWPSLRDLVASMPLPEMTLSALSRCLGDDGLINAVLDFLKGGVVQQSCTECACVRSRISLSSTTSPSTFRMTT